jgi:hypothetical protein
MDFDVATPRNGTSIHVPPVEGARLEVCKNGPNVGCKYWAVREKDSFGNWKLKFFDWVDVPATDIRLNFARLEEKIDLLTALLKSEKQE